MELTTPALLFPAISLLLVISLIVSLYKIIISTKAIEIELEQLENLFRKNPVTGSADMTLFIRIIGYSVAL